MYTIKLLSDRNLESMTKKIVEDLQTVLKLDGRFTVDLEVDERKILLKRVRLVGKKEYCGNHPGECAVGPFADRSKRKTRFLEWDDWVAFHGLVNDVLDTGMNFGPTGKVAADVWSNPQDARGKFWMRKGEQRRLRYEWSEGEMKQPGILGMIRPVRVWNCGTPDQFEVQQ